mmetsp:Transcript_14032/g.30090  ORF Transcript_14032/g.30090 Transcript_14032/m.30090 type:complete len:121 (-) Transcript_14032:815-1177(-)
MTDEGLTLSPRVGMLLLQSASEALLTSSVLVLPGAVGKTTSGTISSSSSSSATILPTTVPPPCFQLHSLFMYPLFLSIWHSRKSYWWIVHLYSIFSPSQMDSSRNLKLPYVSYPSQNIYL